MRVGDFSVEVIGAGGGTTDELESGHVVARPGQVYVLRLRNHGPLRCVAEVSIEGHSVTGNGLVINAWSSVDLERPNAHRHELLIRAAREPRTGRALDRVRHLLGNAWRFDRDVRCLAREE